MNAGLLVAAVDVGGTFTKAALIDGDHRVRHTVRRPTPYGADAVVDMVADVLAELRTHATVPLAAAGVVVPGLVDEASGIARLSVNLGWRDADLADRITAKTGTPTYLGHDVRAGALAEWELGAAKGFHEVAFIPIGTGIAAGFISGGRVLTGDGYAGEVGHVTVDPNGELCMCGNRGCLETVSSARALARRYSALTGAEVTTALEVRDRLVAGDPAAAKVWAEGVDAFARVLAMVANMLGPEVVVIGGGLSGAGADLLDPLRTRLAELLTFQRVPELVKASLGDQAACLGAGLLALWNIRGTP
ncbi:ROK family protein [Alloactinosynnema sp. L-07]|uniref:ROK family protein n=1 Tax=Alloactinosynnema sp. L-07 TaxID=1653480 RepID=UPI001E28C090|nr:ROK family protein [Alloactinosynnema sp. L-07]